MNMARRRLMLKSTIMDPALFCFIKILHKTLRRIMTVHDAANDITLLGGMKRLETPCLMLIFFR